MIHVVLDTNIYRSNPNRDNLHFKALEKLAKADLLCLHIPYIVLREFQTQQRGIYSKDLAKTVSGLSGLSRKLLDKNIAEKLSAAKLEIEDESENILSNAENQITNWAKNIGAQIQPLCLDQANLALEAYFQGKPPLKSAKNRGDIPDSFIVQSIYKLHSDVGKIHAVAGDDKIREALSKEESISTYKSLSDFIESELIQNELQEVDLIDSVGAIVTAIQEFEDKSSEIQCFLSSNIGKFIDWETFSELSTSDDNNEATISSYGETKDIKLNFTGSGYYGNGQFGIPFKLKIPVVVTYHIFKSDYHSMDPEIEHVPWISAHNDHYYETEACFELCISGLVSITIDRFNINLNDLSESVVEDGFKISETMDIEVCK